jgi:hypothetical protein
MNIKLGLLVTAMLGGLGCATSGVGRAQPAVAGVDSDGIPSEWAPGAVTGAAACHATSRANVLARRVFVPGSVEASEQHGSFSVRFATAASRCVAVEWPSPFEGPRPASCPLPGAHTTARADSSDETMLAWESHDTERPHITLGVVTYDAPHAFFGVGIEGKRNVVERTFYAPGASLGHGEMAPELTPIGQDRFLLAWVEGNVEGNKLRAQSVVGWGDPLGPSMVLSPEDASVIGRPSVVVSATGNGLVTYLASIDGEFDVLATPIACAMN